MTFALTVYPLSGTYRQRFEADLGERPRYLNIGELRREGAVGALRTLVACRGVCYLPLEDENSGVLFPILHTMAALSGASRIVLVDADLTRRRISRLGAMRAIVGLVLASISGQFTRWRCRRQLRRIDSSGHAVPALPTGPRVAYLKTNLWFGVKAGGSIGHVAGVVNGLTRAGWAVDYLSAEAPVMLDPSVRVAPLRPPKVYGLPAEINLWRFHEQFTRQARAYLAENHPDFIYQRMPVSNFSGVDLARSLGVPLVLEYNGSEVWIARNWGHPLRYEADAELAERVCLQHADLVVTVSDVLGDDLVSKGVPRDRIVVYPNGIDPDIYDPERFPAETRGAILEQLGLPEDVVVITFVGTFGQWHGTEVLARAIVTMAQTHAEWLRARNVHFLMVGDGLKMAEVRQVLEAGAPASLYTLTGLVPQADAVAYLACSDIFVSPHVRNEDNSRFFGSPTKLFEYMSMGRAIVASDLDQIGEVLAGSPYPDMLAGVEDLAPEACSVLVPPGSVTTLVDALRALVDDAAMRAELGRRARRRALQSYTWDRHVQAILQGLDRVLGGHGLGVSVEAQRTGNRS